MTVGTGSITGNAIAHITISRRLEVRPVSDTDPENLLGDLIEDIWTQEEQRPRRKRLQRKGRVRNKFRLLDKWESVLDSYDGPGDAALVDGYRPSGAAPVDVPEIAGLIVWDADCTAHHFRLYRDETAYFIESPDDPEARIAVDPMHDPPGNKPIYVTDGPPEAVTNLLDTLDITPRWHNACDDGTHEFTTVNEDSAYAFAQCAECECPAHVLSWLGHAVPYDEAE